ncbi:MAG: hypothetical protein C0617_05960 [Desulfuromonas sp.]|uniref:DUF3147 family protein n=1 Tax=Desulfuromonas sp. TaxID=892 RepID=UPI000CB8AD0C|nr:DUF3147 family protein [Desulfuromonas sp.]PLX84949.1 MAG: hypothetical protein C0617_05960 [Desulfuromonas sp.]
MYFFLKVVISALVIAGVSEVARRHTPLAAILASLPLTSILALLWLYHDTLDIQVVSDLTGQIFWALLPSLLFFLILPRLLRGGMPFVPALLLAVLLMVCAYALYAGVLKRLGVDL